MGDIITVSAGCRLLNPPATEKVLGDMHPDLWWGAFMLVFGILFTFLHRTAKPPLASENR
jgi:hypothetical protein